jgi:hypothetical protein
VALLWICQYPCSLFTPAPTAAAVARLALWVLTQLLLQLLLMPEQ